jgi:hypothetical protein
MPNGSRADVPQRIVVSAKYKTRAGRMEKATAVLDGALKNCSPPLAAEIAAARAYPYPDVDQVEALSRVAVKAEGLSVAATALGGSLPAAVARSLPDLGRMRNGAAAMIEGAGCLEALRRCTQGGAPVPLLLLALAQCEAVRRKVMGHLGDRRLLADLAALQEELAVRVRDPTVPPTPERLLAALTCEGCAYCALGMAPDVDVPPGALEDDGVCPFHARREPLPRSLGGYCAHHALREALPRGADGLPPSVNAYVTRLHTAVHALMADAVECARLQGRWARLRHVGPRPATLLAAVHDALTQPFLAPLHLDMLASLLHVRLVVLLPEEAPLLLGRAEADAPLVWLGLNAVRVHLVAAPMSARTPRSARAARTPEAHDGLQWALAGWDEDEDDDEQSAWEAAEEQRAL